MKRIPRRTFTEEFKREAIKLVTEQGLKLSEVSKRLDVTTKSLKTWMDLQAKGELKSSLGADKLSAEQRRIRELERELAIAKMEHRQSHRPPKTGRFTFSHGYQDGA